MIHHISAPIKNSRRITHLPYSEPVLSHVPKVTAPYSTVLILKCNCWEHLSCIWSNGTSTLAQPLISAADLSVGIPKRASTYPAKSPEMSRPCFWSAKPLSWQLLIGGSVLPPPLARISLFLPNGLFMTPVVVFMESRSKSSSSLCTISHAMYSLSWPGARLYIMQCLAPSHKYSFIECTTTYSRRQITKVSEVLSLVALNESCKPHSS